VLILISLTFVPNAAHSQERKADMDSSAPPKEPYPADKEKAAAFVRENRSGIVFVKGKLGSGSAFIANMKGRKVLITNAHVMAAIKSPTFELLDRTPLREGAASAAVGHDLIAMVVVEGGVAGIPVLEEMDNEIAIGDAIVVLGNAQGGGVVNSLHGELTGIGPDRLEINSLIEPGNSGSPIVHLRTGKVIGVATCIRLDSLLSGGEKLRRFGFRLDNVKTWQRIE
jgi:S1-C subfamily serine protease